MAQEGRSRSRARGHELRAAVTRIRDGTPKAVRFGKHPAPNTSLGDMGVAVRVAEREDSVVVIPVEPEQIAGIDPTTIKVFRVDERRRAYRLIWRSGYNEAFGYAWAKTRREGTYVAVGLPRDRLVQEAIRALAVRRRAEDADDGDFEKLGPELIEVLRTVTGEQAAELRAFIATLEVKHALGGVPMADLQFGEGGHIIGLKLPGNATVGQFNERVENLRVPLDGLPEEQLIFPPEVIRDGSPPWDSRPADRPWEGIPPDLLDNIVDRKLSDWLFDRISLCWLLSRNWWMYHRDARHTGQVSCSDINSGNVSRMRLLRTVPVDGTVVTIPTIVYGKVYVGTAGYGTNAGTLYKIDLATGTVDGTFATTGNAFYPYDGIGSSPAVVGGRIYFTAVHGKVYCVDAATMMSVWTTNLKYADAAHNQPVTNPQADSWTSPLVVNGRVYVGAGEGEASAFTPGFIYCLDAATGNVLWLFCTNQFQAGVDNSANVIPTSVVGLSPLPSMFSTAAPTSWWGASPWSSCAYDRDLNRIYIGTGNPKPDVPLALPDPSYASGVLSLDATTGAFKAFFQPAASDSYRPGDFDVDVPAAPTIVDRGGGDRAIAIGSKNGSFFLLHPDTLAVLARRQLLPRNAATGAAISTVDPTGGTGENKWGVLGTAAIHSGTGKLFVGLGGYVGIDDYRMTPFVRALDWNTLADAWPTTTDTVAGTPVVRYSIARPPLYTTPLEGGLSSPAVVNDVVFVSTSKTGMYALDVDTGLCLWAAPGMPIVSGWPDYSLGPAVYGNYVVVGAANQINIYRLRTWFLPPIVLDPWWQRYIRWPIPWPPPPPPWDSREPIEVGPALDR